MIISKYLPKVIKSDPIVLPSAGLIQAQESTNTSGGDATGSGGTVAYSIGQSLGGLLAAEILLKKPYLFDNYIIVSPSLWWDDESLLDEEPVFYDSNKSIYVAGGKEGELMERTAKELYEKLKKNKNQSTQLFYDFLENKSHGDALHIAVYNAFEKIFNSKKN